MLAETHSPNVRWSAVVAGLFIALAVQVALGLFGESAGWQLVVTIVSPFAGALVAVWMSRPEGQSGAMLTGILVWALTLVASSLLLMGLFSARVVMTDGGLPGLTRGWSGFWAGLSALLSLGGAIIGALVAHRPRPAHSTATAVQREEGFKATVRDVGPPPEPPAPLPRREDRTEPPHLH